MEDQKIQNIMNQVRELIGNRIEQARMRSIGDKARKVVDPIARAYSCDPEPRECYERGSLRVDKPNSYSVRVQWAKKDVYIEKDSSSNDIMCYVPDDEWETALDEALENAPAEVLREFVKSRWGLDPHTALYDPETGTLLD